MRETNEDNYFLALERKLFIVSDGMGGHQAGAVASNAVVTVLPKLLEKLLADGRSLRADAIERALRDAIVKLSVSLRDESAGREALQGLGATVVCVWMHGAKAHLAHMGDSRIYLFRAGRLKQLTDDHSIIALLLKRGEVTADEARDHPARSKLSRYVGMGGEVYPDVRTLGVRDGDRFLLCSDGLTGMLADDEIRKLLEVNPDASATCNALVAAANKAGGEDNVTALVVDCVHLGT